MPRPRTQPFCHCLSGAHTTPATRPCWACSHPACRQRSLLAWTGNVHRADRVCPLRPAQPALAAPGIQRGYRVAATVVGTVAPRPAARLCRPRRRRASFVLQRRGDLGRYRSAPRAPGGPCRRESHTAPPRRPAAAPSLGSSPTVGLGR